MPKLKTNSATELPKARPALTPEAREEQLIAYAVDLAEKQLREGTASSQVITHYLKLGSTKDRLEKDILRKQKDLIEAKTAAIQANQKMEELYSKALAAFSSYSGEGDSNNDQGSTY